jgi:hypothetical protein
MDFGRGRGLCLLHCHYDASANTPSLDSLGGSRRGREERETRRDGWGGDLATQAWEEGGREEVGRTKGGRDEGGGGVRKVQVGCRREGQEASTKAD